MNDRPQASVFRQTLLEAFAFGWVAISVVVFVVLVIAGIFSLFT